jgi:predicted lipid-binding transport protein (Tim44 family)
MKKATQKRDVVNDHFFRDTTNMKLEEMGNFKKKSANLIIENSGWGKNVQENIADISMMLEKITKVAREKEINKLQELTKKAFFDTAEEIINEPIY